MWVAYRFLSNRKMREHRLPAVLSVSGIAIGVAALIVVLSVMNGFQMGFIEDILEIRSYHLRITTPTLLPTGLVDEIQGLPFVSAFFPFRDEQTLAAGVAQNGTAAYEPIALRGILPADISADPGFYEQIEIVSGKFTLELPGTLILGSELADSLSARVGSTVSLVSLASARIAGLRLSTRELTVTGIFSSGFLDIDAIMAFCSLDTIQEVAPARDGYQYGVKLTKRFRDIDAIERIHGLLIDREVTIESWRDYNRAFFGALRIEKRVMTLLLGLIFVVVAVNIALSLARSVSEKREAISVLKTLGGTPAEVRLVFILQGAFIGIVGSMIGTSLGLLIVTRIDSVFAFVEGIAAWGYRVIYALFRLGVPNRYISILTPSFFYLSGVPVRIVFIEVFFTVVAALLVSVGAAALASRRVSEIEPQKVLRYE